MELPAAERKIEAFVKDIIDSSGTQGVIIGLSGGIDSALVAALCTRALGREKVLGLFCYESERIPDLNTNTDFSDVSRLADDLGIEFLIIDMSPVLNAAGTTIAHAHALGGEAVRIPGSETDLCKGNLRARMRMSVLYYYANRLNFLVAGTANRTELLTGYYTKYGDGGVDINPVGDLYKTEVRQLARYLGIPKSILEKTPSAGFWEGQSDEADLGISYDDLDKFLRLTVDENKDRETVLRETGMDGELYASLTARLRSGTHKRNIPPIPPVH